MKDEGQGDDGDGDGGDGGGGGDEGTRVNRRVGTGEYTKPRTIIQF